MPRVPPALRPALALFCVTAFAPWAIPGPVVAQVVAQVSTQVSAQPTTPVKLCRVADPSPTPTNLRATPAGALLGTIANGTVVEIVADADGGGRPWALVVRPGAATIAGWVARSLVKCG